MENPEQRKLYLSDAERTNVLSALAELKATAKFNTALPSKMTALAGRALGALATPRKQKRLRDADVTEAFQALEVLHNQCGSMADGTPEERHELLREIRPTIESIIEMVKAIDTKNEEESDDPEEVSDKKIATVYRKFQADMPKPAHSVKHLSVMVDVPVLPVFQHPVDAGKLKRAGIAATEFSGFYVVLENQRLIGMNTAALRKADMDFNEYLKSVLLALKNRTGKQWLQPCERAIAYRNDGYKYYWVMPERQLTVLGAQSAIVEWGLPF